MLNHIVLIIMDSCRYDSCLAARRCNIDRVGALQRRYSYASWTSPSHCVFLMGLMPHNNPPGTFASEIYKTEFSNWVERIGGDDVSFRTFVPHLSLPKVLHDLGYRTCGRVSLPVLNEFTAFSSHFDDYRLMDNHNDFAGMVRDIEFPANQPMFWFLNLGETHYPYMLPDMPRISGLHGVFKPEAAQRAEGGLKAPDALFDADQMARLHQQQVRCVEHVDNLIGALFDKAPVNTHFVITADHGEMFGEDGFFGHGPVMHPKCFEVPYVEGRRPA